LQPLTIPTNIRAIAPGFHNSLTLSRSSYIFHAKLISSLPLNPMMQHALDSAEFCTFTYLDVQMLKHSNNI
jgi:hypothetical protein